MLSERFIYIYIKKYLASYILLKLVLFTQTKMDYDLTNKKGKWFKKSHISLFCYTRFLYTNIKPCIYDTHPKK